MKNQDTFTLWGVQDIDTGKVFVVRESREQARKSNWNNRVVKLECRIVDQRPKKPKKPKTFTAHGLEWIPHTPGDPMPCGGEKDVRVLWRRELDGRYEHSTREADSFGWYFKPEIGEEIIGWNYADAK